ncbi:MAG: DUF2249 domain-containing protein [Actinomycetes bacterium]
MDNVVIASSDADAAAAAAVEQHHAQMAGTLGLKVEQVLVAVSQQDIGSATSAKADLVAWCEHELVPHALAEEKAMYPAALRKPEGRLLVEGMLAEHVVITGLVRDIAEASDVVRAAAAAKALQVMFESHLGKENDLVLPLLTSASDVSVAELLGGMHELLGAETGGGHEHGQAAGDAGCGGHACTCGEVDGPGFPELDVRPVPHAIRHATVFGALDAVAPGGGMVLVAPHDPLPLLAQVDQRFAGAFAVDYLERGPEAWRIAFVRRAAA